MSLVGGFLTKPADTFLIVDADQSLSGQFANAPSTIQANGGTFQVTYLPDGVLLSGFDVQVSHVVVPNSFLVTEGTYVLGGIAELADSAAAFYLLHRSVYVDHF